VVKLAPWPIGGCCRLTISKRSKPSSWVRVERGFRVLKSEIELAPHFYSHRYSHQGSHGGELPGITTVAEFLFIYIFQPLRAQF